MNILGIVLLISALVVVLAIGIDIGSQIWAEKLAKRQPKAVSHPKKSVGGRHRMSTA